MAKLHMQALPGGDRFEVYIDKADHSLLVTDPMSTSYTVTLTVTAGKIGDANSNTVRSVALETAVV